MKTPEPLDDIRAFYDRDLVSPWLSIDQELINQFAAATLDSDWLHIDPARARREAPFGGTIAHGFWTLSVLTHLLREACGRDYPPGARYGLNYGFDRVRFPAPAPVGGRVRARARLLAVDEKSPGRYLVKTDIRVELEGEEKPAVAAEWLTLLVY